MEQKQVEEHVRALEKRVAKRIEQSNYAKEENTKHLLREKTIIYTGKILHIDGDTHLKNKKNTVISILPSR